MTYLIMPLGCMKLLPREGLLTQAYSLRASFAFGRRALLLHFLQRVARIAFRA